MLYSPIAMGRRGPFSPLRMISLLLLLSAVILLTLQLVRFSRLRSTLPEGMRIGGVPVSGLDRQAAAQRLLEAYTATPVELHYGDSMIQIDPAVAEFKLDLESMLAAAELNRSEQSFWVDFWNFLWGRTTPPADIPLRSSFSEARLRTYLRDEIAARYDQPPLPSIPAVGTVNFQPGKQGTVLDIDQSIPLIESAFQSISNRVVDLPLGRTDPPRPSFQNLEILLKQTVDLSEFDGLVGLYMLDLNTADEIHFAYQQGQDYPTNPDIAFTAASIIKIPIMVSTFRRLGEIPDQETIKLLEEMIEKSGNDPADWVMERVIDPNIAPIEVTNDLHALGLESTFLAGQFFPGAPLLASFETPANTRGDINTDPDIYNQTTPSEIGMLLEDIYQCNQSGGGTLMAVFPGDFTQRECQTMLTYLTRNNLGLLIEAGVPDGTEVAHKHGWVTYFGVMNTLGDAGIVYSPGGNYVLVIFLYKPGELIWDPASELVASLSQAVYNYFNYPSP
ncbi:MAG TPA: serine hydrolase [Anaerolineales bacterium]|nr:serine hydrolase [Anaerolineales bacterium]